MQLNTGWTMNNARYDLETDSSKRQKYGIESDAIDSLRERFDEWKLISMKQDETEAYLWGAWFM